MGMGEQRMRVIAGTLKGRRLVSPKGESTRPTTDRVREALFSSLTSHLAQGFDGMHVLDAFAGSGALGIEALSRGATTATFVELAPSALAVLRSNLAALALESRARVVSGDVFSLAARGVGTGYSLILLDPPYTLDAACVQNLLGSFVTCGAVCEGTLVSWEHSIDTPVTWPRDFHSIAAKRYGTIGVDLARYSTREAGS